MARSYRDVTLEGASGIELIVALYDGLIRFLGQAALAAEAGDQAGQRGAVRRAAGILVYLQARLRPEAGRPAGVLAEFYAAILALILRATREGSAAQFHHAIQCVRNVRDAWQQASASIGAGQAHPEHAAAVHAAAPPAEERAARWTA